MIVSICISISPCMSTDRLVAFAIFYLLYFFLRLYSRAIVRGGGLVTYSSSI
jgi:hypothetical protein